MITRRRLGQTAAAALAAPYLIRPADAQAATTLVVAATRTPGGFDGDALKPNTQNVVVVFPVGEGYKPGEYVDVFVHDCTTVTLLGKVVS